MSTEKSGTKRRATFAKQRTTFLRNIRELVDEAGSDNAFCSRTGIPRGTLDKWRRGDMPKGPAADSLLAIAHAFDTTVDWLLLGAKRAARLPSAREVSDQAVAKAVGDRIVAALRSETKPVAFVDLLAPNVEALGAAVLEFATTQAIAEAQAICQASEDVSAARVILEAIPGPMAYEVGGPDQAAEDRIKAMNQLHERVTDMFRRSMQVDARIWTSKRTGVPSAAGLVGDPGLQVPGSDWRNLTGARW